MSSTLTAVEHPIGPLVSCAHADDEVYAWEYNLNAGGGLAGWATAALLGSEAENDAGPHVCGARNLYGCLNGRVCCSAMRQAARLNVQVTPRWDPTPG